MTPLIAHMTTGSENPSKRVESAPTAGGTEPSATVALPDLAAAEASAFLTGELTRRHAELQRTLESVKTVLTGLERQREAAIEEHQRETAAGVSALVEKLLMAATGHVEAAERRGRDEAHVQIADVQALVERLKDELKVERERVDTAHDTLDQEQAARRRVEAACAEQELGHQERAAQNESRLQAVQDELEAQRAECFRLRQQLDLEQSERAKFAAALQTVQRAVSFAEPIHADDATSSAYVAQPVDRSPAQGPGERAVPGTITRQGLASSGGGPVSVDGPASPTGPTSPSGPTLTLVRSTPPSEVEPDPELLEYVKRLLDDVETMYWADLETARGPEEVVSRLTANLRYARDVFSRRQNAEESEETTLFEQELMKLLDQTSESSFGRHLAFSAYELYPVADRRPAPSAIRPNTMKS
jgi:hypothetical protein